MNSWLWPHVCLDVSARRARAVALRNSPARARVAVVAAALEMTEESEASGEPAGWALSELRAAGAPGAGWGPGAGAAVWEPGAAWDPLAPPARFEPQTKTPKTVALTNRARNGPRYPP